MDELSRKRIERATIRGMMAEPQSGATGGMKKKGKPDEKV